MKPTDIRPLGAGAGIGYYWVQQASTFGRWLAQVAISELGEVTYTGLNAAWHDAALTEGEAVVEHLGAAIAEADADLERRKKDAPEPAPQPPPMDRATQRFFYDRD